MGEDHTAPWDIDRAGRHYLADAPPLPRPPLPGGEGEHKAAISVQLSA